MTQTSLASGLQSTFHRTGMLHYISQCQTRDYTKPMSDPRPHQANVRPETTPSQCQTRDHTKPMSDPRLHQANVRPETTPSQCQTNVRHETTPSQCQTRDYTKPMSDPRLHQANVRPETTPSQCQTQDYTKPMCHCLAYTYHSLLEYWSTWTISFQIKHDSVCLLHAANWYK